MVYAAGVGTHLANWAQALGSTTNVLSPPSTNVLTGVAQLALGSRFTCALMIANGGVRCWGRNDYGQLGTGNAGDLYSPPTIDILTGVSFIGGGLNFMCAIMASDGGVRCWGRNDYGQLGNGSTFPYVLAPPTTSVLLGALYVEGGGLHTCVQMAATGGVRCWGLNDFGQLGVGTTTNTNSPPPTDLVIV